MSIINLKARILEVMTRIKGVLSNTRRERQRLAALRRPHTHLLDRETQLVDILSILMDIANNPGTPEEIQQRIQVCIRKIEDLMREPPQDPPWVS